MKGRRVAMMTEARTGATLAPAKAVAASER